MPRFSRLLHTLLQPLRALLPLLCDAERFLRLCLCPSAALAAENLFLRKQLALDLERHVLPRRATPATPPGMVWLARRCDWRQALAVVQPKKPKAGRRPREFCEPQEEHAAA